MSICPMSFTIESRLILLEAVFLLNFYFAISAFFLSISEAINVLGSLWPAIFSIGKPLKLYLDLLFRSIFL